MERIAYAEAARVLGESPHSRRWEEYMASIMESAAGDAYDPDNAYPDGLPEVFFWEAD
jgi:L-rhamnose mutarotase